MSNVTAIGKKCPKCGADEWFIIDETNIYKQFCNKCFNYIEIIKIDYLKNFQCQECNCLEGTIEENDNLLAVRCKHCGKQTIMLEKHTTENRRDINSKPSKPMTYEEMVNAKQPKCPKCGSTSIQIVQRKWNLFSGFATNKTDRVCVNCKYRW